MPVYYARWKDGSFSLVEADDTEQAYELLDEFGDEPADLFPVGSCLMDFELTERGSLQLQDFGEVMRDEVLEKGYPLLRRALEQAAAAEYDPEPAEVPVQQSDVPADVTEAVKKERERFAGFQPDPANTEFGKYMHEQTNISGRNADRVIKRKAKERLAKFSVDKRQKPN